MFAAVSVRRPRRRHVRRSGSRPRHGPQVVRDPQVDAQLRGSARARGGRGRTARDPARPPGAASPTSAMGLTFSQDACANEFGEFPCYVPRGRWDDGVYVSVEHSSSYVGFDEGLYIVMLASGSPRDRDDRRGAAPREGPVPRRRPSRPRPSTWAASTSGLASQAPAREGRASRDVGHQPAVISRLHRPPGRCAHPDRETRRCGRGGSGGSEHAVRPGEAEAAAAGFPGVVGELAHPGGEVGVGRRVEVAGDDEAAPCRGAARCRAAPPRPGGSSACTPASAAAAGGC